MEELFLMDLFSQAPAAFAFGFDYYDDYDNDIMNGNEFFSVSDCKWTSSSYIVYPSTKGKYHKQQHMHFIQCAYENCQQSDRSHKQASPTEDGSFGLMWTGVTHTPSNIK